MIRDDTQRTLLFDLDMAINQVTEAIREHRAAIALTSCYHNLLRGWAEGCSGRGVRGAPRCDTL
jgi:PKHD-type hydroxylase